MKLITSIDDQSVIRKSAHSELLKKLAKITEYAYYMKLTLNPFDDEHILEWKTSDDTPFFYNQETHQLLLKVDRMPELEELNEDGICPEMLIYSSFKKDIENAQCYIGAMYDRFNYEVKLKIVAYKDIEDGELIPVRVPDNLNEYKQACLSAYEIESLRRDKRIEITVGMWEDMQKLLKKHGEEIQKLKKLITR